MSPTTVAWRSQTGPRPATFWPETAPARRADLPLDGDTTADVVVIGAGASGLWTAWALLDADPAIDLLVIEQDAVGNGASGSAIGVCSAWTGGVPRPGRSQSSLPDTGPLRDAVVEVGGTLAAEQIDCDFQYRGALRVADDQRALARLRAAADPATEDHELDREDLARRLLLPGGYGGISTPDCATVHPSRLLRGLANTLQSRGTRIAERTRALRISAGAVVTDQGIIRAGRIVQATGASAVPGGTWSPRPIAASAIATAPVPAELWERLGLRRGQLLHCPADGDLRAVRTADDRLVVSREDAGSGGRRGVRDSLHRQAMRGPRLWRRAPRPLTRARSAQTNVDMLGIELSRLFPDLARIPLTHAWSWTRAATVAYPVGVASTGIAWIGGHGPEPIAAANLSGRALAGLLTGTDGAACGG